MTQGQVYCGNARHISEHSKNSDSMDNRALLKVNSADIEGVEV
jgi:hypothetical protein